MSFETELYEGEFVTFHFRHIQLNWLWNLYKGLQNNLFISI